MASSNHEIHKQAVLKQDLKCIPIHVPEDARRTGTASAEIITEVVAYLHRDGILVLEDIIDASHLDALESQLAPEAAE